jgi:acetate kinase
VQRLAWLGAQLDTKRNAQHDWCISNNDSRMKVFVVPTDEEQEMVRQAFNV